MIFSKITSAKVIRDNIADAPKSGGVYKHFINKEGLKYLSGVDPTEQETADDGSTVYLLYIGLAKDIQYRLKWHLGIVNVSHSCIVHGTLSTLRLSYMSNHENINCLSEQEKLNEFLNKYVYMSYYETPDFKSIESSLISSHDLPLNIKDNKHSFVQTNKARRKEMKAAYKQLTSTSNGTKTVG
ncbi:hypothetical protein CXF85_15245 [Colwellia sp. 75C3]|uniref:GIY-YIG nuclease family protein n=1 Tax=Colwellia sp. 75C3 TaxID=888425 RepID=UPI000C323E0D|nr:hypothetical protein [Colwellia sp. 75C3]PKG81890.1 hypothetical protein CXF85_15245 [Colwellia sp. 75C3]